jgi:1-acyl-sn-glycerol-3-phosphate acyltransferase
MIKTIIFFIGFGISLIISMIPAGIYWVLGLLHLKNAQHALMLSVTSAWARTMLFLTGNKVEVYNQEVVPKGPVLFVSNHQSNFDIPVCMACLPYFAPFIAKVELEKVPMLSYWMKEMECLFMDRKDMRQSLKIILQGIDMLKAGKSLVIFPEGTRAKDGEMMDFKPGSLKLAVKAGVPIVPFTIKNTYKVYEEHNRIKKAQVSITFHEPIDTSQLSRDEINALHVTVRDIIKTTLER